MATDTIIQATKRRVWRWVKVVGLYSLWRSLGGTITLLVFGLLMLGAVRYLSATPPDSFILPMSPPPRNTIFPSMDIPSLQRTTDTFFRGLPYVGPIWGHLPVFNHRQPMSFVWALLIPIGWLGTHLMHKK
jgi:hypothetical protein